jgi:hypothetical protein
MAYPQTPSNFLETLGLMRNETAPMTSGFGMLGQNPREGQGAYSSSRPRLPTRLDIKIEAMHIWRSAMRTAPHLCGMHYYA